MSAPAAGTVGTFAEPGGRLLTVIDSEPTGSSILDAALSGLAGKKKPWRTERALLALYDPVMAAVYESLEARGLARADGKSGGRRTTWYSAEATPTIGAILDGEGFPNESL
jgi:hypothetical protein